MSFFVNRVAAVLVGFLFMDLAARVNNVNSRAGPFRYCLYLFGVGVMSLSGALTRKLCGELIKMLLDSVLRKKGTNRIG